jgi:hypothetical protein
MEPDFGTVKQSVKEAEQTLIASERYAIEVNEFRKETIRNDYLPASPSFNAEDCRQQ